MALLELKEIKKYFPVKRGFAQRVISYVHAADNISLSVEKSKNLGIVGESGCGKSTLARVITKLVKPDSGQIIFRDQDITHFSDRKMRALRPYIQMVFQDPFNSLDPRFTVKNILREAFVAFHIGDRVGVEKDIVDLLKNVGLSADCLHRYPYEFSGGERQRIAIARALVAKPELLILDEAVSSLDILMQTQILNLLYALQGKFDLTYLLISHNLRVIKRMTYRVAVMYLGRIVEIADTRDIFVKPLHPYTDALIAAAVELRVALKGEVPSGLDIPSGCRFHPRCPYQKKICSEVEPLLEQKSPGRYAACHFPLF